MEKDNKYYSLIEKLVKNHRKYSGYEAILEEIVDDVYKHSASVISTIDNEEVIQSYLQKVVSTSIITVPKRLNFNNTVKHRTITVDAPILKVEESVNLSKEELLKDSVDDIKETKQIVSEIENLSEETQDKQKEVTNTESEAVLAVHTSEEISVNKELVDKMINSIETESVIDNVDENSIKSVSNDVENSDYVTEDLLVQDEKINYSEVSSVDDLDMLEVEDADSLELIANVEDVEDDGSSVDIEEKNIESDSLEEVTATDDTEKTELSFAEVELIDEGEAEDTELEPIAYENSEEVETDLIENINLDIDEQEEQEFIADAVEQQDINDEEVIELELEDTEDLSNNVDNSELLSTDIDNDKSVLSEDIIEPIESVEEIDLIDSGLKIENSDDIELQQEDIFDATLEISNDDVLTEELIGQDDLQEVELEDNTLLDAPINMSVDVENLEISDEDIDVREEIVHKAIDYSAFNYTPVEEEDNNIDADIISNRLVKLNNDKPELNILKIFDLKYKQNQTIENIANELNIDKSSVITALDEMVDLI